MCPTEHPTSALSTRPGLNRRSRVRAAPVAGAGNRTAENPDGTERLRFKARGNPYRTDDGGEDGKRPPPSFLPGQSRYSDGTAPALCLSRREGKVMETILIIVVLLFLFGGGGYYWRSRRG
jgi:hypothetical protein